MMRVIVEVIPFGVEGARKTLALIEIANVSELAPVSDYEINAQLADRAPLVRARVEGHRRADGWESLVRRSIAEVKAAAWPTGGHDAEG